MKKPPESWEFHKLCVQCERNNLHLNILLTKTSGWFLLPGRNLPRYGVVDIRGHGPRRQHKMCISCGRNRYWWAFAQKTNAYSLCSLFALVFGLDVWVSHLMNMVWIQDGFRSHLVLAIREVILTRYYDYYHYYLSSRMVKLEGDLITNVSLLTDM